MPRVDLNQTNFTSGEITPRCYGRVDIARYLNGAASLENCFVTIHGGAYRRYASSYQATAKTLGRFVRLVPFVFSTTQAYILEFGHLYLRIYNQGGGQVMNGGVPYELVTPYSEDMLREMDFTQGADTMLLFHQSVYPQTLRRLSGGAWSIGAAPFTTLPFDEVGHRYNGTLTLSAATVGTGRTATSTIASFIAADVGRRITFEGGSGLITAVNSGTQVTMQITSEFSSTVIAANQWVLDDSPQVSITPGDKSPVGIGINVTCTTDAFRAIDVGKFIEINGGLLHVDSVSSAQAIVCKIIKELDSAVAAPAGAWKLLGPAWNEFDGYPRTGEFYEQRLNVAGSTGYPQTLWGSKTGAFFDFTMGTDDDDAYAFTLPSTGKINPITRMSSVSVLIMLTYGGEYTATGGVEKPLTPTNPQLKPRTRYGCNSVKPLQVGEELFYVTRTGKKVRAMSYSYTSDSFPSPNVTTLAEHITSPGIVDMAYQQEPDGRLWCVRADGKLAVLTIDREEGVTAWSPQSTDGVYESVACIPNGGIDEVWVSVKRTIGGVDYRYIERFDDSLLTDSAITDTDATGKTEWTGLAHLEGKQVHVRADGTFAGAFTVAGGKITLPRSAKTVQIGLPYTARIIPLRPEIQTGAGTAQANKMNTSKVSVLLHESIGGMINGQKLTQRAFGSELLDQELQVYSGLDYVGITDWHNGDSPIVLEQSEPLPFHVLSIIRKFTVNP
ncbi:hypothetical protein I5R65_07705 [Herbaspirillum sp. AP02]|uniref:hypothetical protein n=1 Tax=unclassified Herbaspirillum TaxID=2624150 RepID=UPI0015DA47AF|nr:MULTISPECIES: hypothetical protein [unclassified Herbaspirillum]MBG7619345.1 hypothetical protein [Herbaspirillum sp. AP02]NZD66629.1 hypothetical protein [Herbaspirillum sp. AP21]